MLLELNVHIDFIIYILQDTINRIRIFSVFISIIHLVITIHRNSVEV